MPLSIKELFLPTPISHFSLLLWVKYPQVHIGKNLHTDNEIGQRLRFVGVQVSSTVLSNTKERLERIKFSGFQ